MNVDSAKANHYNGRKREQSVLTEMSSLFLLGDIFAAYSQLRITRINELVFFYILPHLNSYIDTKNKAEDEMVNNIKGLSESEVIASREKYGDNSLLREKTKGFFGKFLENLSDPIIRVLLIAVIIEVVFTFGRCNWWETGGIIVAVLIATTVSTISEYGSEKAFNKMEDENNNFTAKVLRDGELKDIPINEVVVGDVLFLSSAQTVYADGEMIFGKVLVDQSALNGESTEVLKTVSGKSKKGDFSSEKDVFRGSVVCDGEGIIRVTKVGRDTYYGMVAKDIQAETRESPLKFRLGQLASQISKIGYFMAFLVGFTYLFFAIVAENNYLWANIVEDLKDISFTAVTLTHALTLMITVIVVAVPEGLPMMITVVLSANMKRMLNDKIMVKKLVGIETAGSMNILFTDKTGTLTEGKTTVEQIICVDGVYKTAKNLRKSAKVYKFINISAKDGASQLVKNMGGNSTDKALFSFFSEEKQEKVEIKEIIPFNSDRKFSSITLSSGEKIIKGAPEFIIPSCKYAINEKGEKELYEFSKMLTRCREFSLSGARVIAICVEENGERSFLSLVILKDKIRRGVKESVEKMLSAGVKVVMVTGDSKETAISIAKECGIIPKHKISGVLTHDDIEKMTDEELKKEIPNLYVLSRALPRDKSRLVRLSQELNLVVGMTGDGINDAPSLKLADVGFSMGSGTDIAKSAGDIVILDNSFMAISKTVLYGRTIFKSIRKFISFQLMMNLTACGVSLIGQFIGIENPITIIQMLWINIIMDTLGGLAFAGEAPLDYYMMEKTKTREEKILSKDMLYQIASTGLYTLLLCILFLKADFFKMLFRSDEKNIYFLTGFYALFVFSGLFNCFNTRSERLSLFSNISKNKPFIFIMTAIAIIQILMIYFGGEVFRSAPLTFREFLNVFILASTVIPFDMIRRIFKKLSK